MSSIYRCQARKASRGASTGRWRISLSVCTLYNIRLANSSFNTQYEEQEKEAKSAAEKANKLQTEVGGRTFYHHDLIFSCE